MISVTIRASPANSRAQLPETPSHLSSAYGNRPCVEMRPAKIAPEIIVIPPTYAKASRPSAARAPNRAALTPPKL